MNMWRAVAGEGARLKREQLDRDGERQMRLPNPATVPAAELADGLTTVASEIIRIDGDRDHMNQSHLNTEQTMLAAQLMLIAAAKLVPAQ